jgi:hypothetical protein
MWKKIFAISIVATLLSGCFSTKEFTQEELQSKSDHNITIRTRDGMVIQCSEGKYTIIDGDPGSIQGKGLILAEKAKHVYNESKNWEGTIPFSEIASVTDDEMTTYSKITVITLGISTTFALGTYLLFAWAFSHQH